MVGSDSENDFRGFNRSEWDEEESSEHSLVAIMDAVSNDSQENIDEPVIADNRNVQIFDDDLPLEHSVNIKPLYDILMAIQIQLCYA